MTVGRNMRKLLTLQRHILTYKRYKVCKMIKINNFLQDRQNSSFSGLISVPVNHKNGASSSVKVNIWQPTYADDIKCDAPVVMAVHGVPGSFEDFKEIGEKLAANGVRFMAPEFPGFGQSSIPKEDVYKLDHSTEGKYKILTSIVSELNLKKIDVMFGHSAGTWLAYKACADMDIIHSGVFVNPLGARPHRAGRPLWAVKSIAWMLSSPIFHPLAYRLLPLIYKIVGFTVTDPRPLQVAVETVSKCGYENMNRYADTIKEKKLPFLFAWTGKDKIVEQEISKEMAHRMGLLDNEIVEIDKKYNKTYPSNFNEDNYQRRALSFERGGHQIQKAHADEVTYHILKLLQYINSQT